MKEELLLRLKESVSFGNQRNMMDTLFPDLRNLTISSQGLFDVKVGTLLTIYIVL